jgi:hypothetical protein
MLSRKPEPTSGKDELVLVQSDQWGPSEALAQKILGVGAA